MKTLRLLGIPTLVCALLFVSNAFANNINVNNSSFETPPVGGFTFGCGLDCSFSENGGIPGWTTSGSGVLNGQFQTGSQAGNFTYFNSIPDGITIAYSNDNTISQTVGATVVAGMTYTLQVDIGARGDGYRFAGTADLMLGNTLCAATGTQPSPGDWSTYTASCTGTSANAGDAITIQLKSSGAQADFDD